MGRHPTTHNTEEELDERVQAASSESSALTQYLTEIGRYARLTPEQEKDLARRAAQGDQEAYERFVTANLRLVVTLAKKYSTPNLALLDLIQEGNIGLMRAVKRYDPERGFRFSTYAAWWIRQAIGIAIAESEPGLHIPGYIMEMVARMRRVQSLLFQQLGRDPEPEELAAQMSISREQILELLSIELRAVSLDAPLDDEGSGSLAEIIPERQSESDEAKDRHDDLFRAMASLDEADRLIIERLYGLGRDPGKARGRRTQSIRQQEQRALAQLRAALEREAVCYS